MSEGGFRQVIEKVVVGTPQQRLRPRRKFLVYPRFQLLLIALNAGISLLAFSAAALSISRSFHQLHEMGLQAALPGDHPYFRFLGMQFGLVQSYLLVALVVAILLSSVVTLILSHRLAGPIVRLRSYFYSIAKQGAPSEPLRFREGDFFTDLPPAINEAVDRLRQK